MVACFHSTNHGALLKHSTNNTFQQSHEQGRSNGAGQVQPHHTVRTNQYHCLWYHKPDWRNYKCTASWFTYNCIAVVRSMLNATCMQSLFKVMRLGSLVGEVRFGSQTCGRLPRSRVRDCIITCSFPYHTTIAECPVDRCGGPFRVIVANVSQNPFGSDQVHQV